MSVRMGVRMNSSIIIHEYSKHYITLSMAGGLLQLRAYGTENLYLNGNPQVSYFKTVYKRHTHFATQSIEVPFETFDSIAYTTSTRIKLKIPRNADLISKFFLNVTIPQITVERGSSQLPFRWIKYLGAQMISRVRILIGGTVIEELTGEYINLYHQTHLTTPQLQNYYELIGHVPELYDPKDSWGNYPYVDTSNTRANPDDPTSPYLNPNYQHEYSLPQRNLSIPLPFWFHRNVGCALPLIALQYHDVVLEIDFRPIRDLYQVGNIETIDLSASVIGIGPSAVVVEPDLQIERIYWTRPASLQAEFTNYSGNGLNTWAIAPIADIQYIFLTADERAAFAKSEHQYLVEKVQLYQELGKRAIVSADIETYHPVKTIYIVPHRTDRDEFNDWSNYTNIDSPDINPMKYQSYYFSRSKAQTDMEPSIPVFSRLGRYRTNAGRNTDVTVTYDVISNTIRKEDAYTTVQIQEFLDNWGLRASGDIPVINNQNRSYYTPNIVNSIEILMNGNPYINIKRSDYFHTNQQFMHHTNRLPGGVLMYSFAIEPEKYQPSGTLNATEIQSFQVYMTTKNPVLYDEPNLFYDFNFHIVQQNVIRIMGGMAGLVYGN